MKKRMLKPMLGFALMLFILLAVVVSATSAVHEIAPYVISFMPAVP